MNAVATAEAYTAPAAEITFDNERAENKLFSIRGRLGVLKYAAQSFLLSVLSVVILTAVGAVAASLGSTGGEGGIGPVAITLVGLVSLPIVFLFLSMAIKRLHDINMSGWFLLLAFVPLVNMFFFLYMMLKPGKLEANKFGAQAVTKGWEKVVGGIYIALVVVSLVSSVIAIATGGVAAFM